MIKLTIGILLNLKVRGDPSSPHNPSLRSANAAFESILPLRGPINPPVVQKKEPELPVKPITQVFIQDENINEELDNVLKSESVNRLKLLISDEAKNNELYFSLATVDKQRRKLQEYLEALRKKSSEVLSLHSLLEESIKKYKEMTTEYSNAKERMGQEMANLERFKDDYIETSGIKSSLRSKKAIIDAQAKVFRKDLEEKLKEKAKDVARHKIHVTEIEECVKDFIKDYSKYMREYNYCDVILESLSK